MYSFFRMVFVCYISQALQILSLYLVDRIQSNHRRKRLRKICTDEGPWRSQVSRGKNRQYLLHNFTHKKKTNVWKLGYLFYTQRVSFRTKLWYTLNQGKRWQKNNGLNFRGRGESTFPSKIVNLLFRKSKHFFNSF